MGENPELSNQQDISRDQSSSSLFIIPKEEITRIRPIGKGYFGNVHQVSWNKDGAPRICAYVYSYGVVLWEMFSYGAMPSQMNHLSNENPFLDQPEACPDDFYALMKKCWSFDSRSRPEFGEIINYLSDLKIAIMKVSTDYDGEHGGEHFYFQKGDNVIAIRDIGEDRIYCQNFKSNQFGEIGAEKLDFVAVSATEQLYEPHSYQQGIHHYQQGKNL
uniref:Serine-threonine/tyrosine-protein kinase catalytic domain-containing protein n=1 Tax=Acrobeloides nanus TaxID=290746 RepID=A0A914CMC4_9BILA